MYIIIDILIENISNYLYFPDLFIFMFRMCDMVNKISSIFYTKHRNENKIANLFVNISNFN